MVFLTKTFKVEIPFLPTIEEKKYNKTKPQYSITLKCIVISLLMYMIKEFGKNNHLSFYYETYFDNIYGCNTQILQMVFPSFTNQIKIIFIILSYFINYFN